MEPESARSEPRTTSEDERERLFCAPRNPSHTYIYVYTYICIWTARRGNESADDYNRSLSCSPSHWKCFCFYYCTMQTFELNDYRTKCVNIRNTHIMKHNYLKWIYTHAHDMLREHIILIMILRVSHMNPTNNVSENTSNLLAQNMLFTN